MFLKFLFAVECGFMELDYYDSEVNCTETDSPSVSMLNFEFGALANTEDERNDCSTDSNDAYINLGPITRLDTPSELDFEPKNPDLESSIARTQRTSRKPKDWLKDVASSDPSQREYALKNLEWQWGIPRRLSETAVQLGSGDIEERTAAQRRLEQMGCEGIPAVHAVNQWNDPEVSIRCGQLMNYYLDTQPLGELLKFPEILEYLPKDPLSQRLDEYALSPERLNRTAKEVDLLMLLPNHVGERVSKIETELSSTTNPEATVLLKEERRRLSNLPLLGQEIQEALANASDDPESKRMHLTRAMEINPSAAQQLDFLWQCQLNNMLGDESFERELLLHGARLESASDRDERLREWVLGEDSRSVRRAMLTEYERQQEKTRLPMEALSDHIFWNKIEEHYSLGEAIERKSLSLTMLKPWPTILGAYIYRLQQAIKVQDPDNPEIQLLEQKLQTLDNWMFPKGPPELPADQ